LIALDSRFVAYERIVTILIRITLLHLTSGAIS
jgi:hypothetical protein